MCNQKLSRLCKVDRLRPVMSDCGHLRMVGCIVSSVQSNLYSAKLQQQLPRGILYCKETGVQSASV